MIPTVSEQKKIIQAIKRLHMKKLYIELFTYVVHEKIAYTQNKNGIFINVSALSPKSFSDVKKLFPNINPKPVQHLLLGPRTQTEPSFSQDNLPVLGKTWENFEVAKTSPNPARLFREHHLGVP